MATIEQAVRERSGEVSGYRFAGGDLDLIRHLARVRWSLAEDLALAVGRSVPKTRQRLSALRRAGLVDLDRPTIGPAAFRATLAGLRMAGAPGPAAKPIVQRVGSTRRGSPRFLRRSAPKGLDYLSEHELRVVLAETRSSEQRALLAAPARGARWRVPDHRVDLGSGVIAVELELHQKSADRLKDILTAHAFAGWRVLYLCPPHVERAIEKAKGRLGPRGQKELAIRMRPAPVMQSDGVGPYRPDPEAVRAIARELAEFARRNGRRS